MRLPVTDPTQTYVVVVRGPSLARIPQGEEIVIPHVPSTTGPARCAFRTHFVNEGFSVEVPRGMYVEVQCAAANADEAFVASLNAAMTLKAYISLSANASVGDFEIELAFDATRNKTEHEYVQQFVRAPSGYH